jgi:HSP20 family protein
MSRFTGDAQDAQRQIERLFHDLVYRRHPAAHFTDTPWAPATDLVVSRGNARVLLELAGVLRENVTVRLTGRSIEITGHRPRPAEPGDARYHRAEIFFGEFRRVIELPWEADAEQVQARFRDGLLEIVLQRTSNLRTEIVVEESGSRT